MVAGAGIWNPLSPDEQVFEFSARWEPLAERGEDARARIERYFGDRFTEWINSRIGLAKSRGYEDAPNWPTEAITMPQSILNSLPVRPWV